MSQSLSHPPEPGSWRPFLALLLSIHLVPLVLQARNASLDADEQQHVHIAWNISQGELLYRDFFDHHGPLFAFWNAALIEVLDLQRGFGIFSFLRGVALIGALLLLLLTGLLARRITGTTRGGLVAAMLLASTWFFQDKASEIRPDGLQAVFSVLSVLLLTIFLQSGRRLALLSAGAAAGLALACNFKAILLIGACLAYWSVELWRHGRRSSQVVREALTFGAGVAGVVLAILAYFAAHGAVADACRSWVTVNFNFLAGGSTLAARVDYRAYMPTQQLAFTLSCVAGTLLLGRDLWRRTWNGSDPRLLLLVVTLVTTGTVISVLHHLYSQQYLMCLPFLAVAGAWGLERWLNGSGYRAATRPWVCLAALALLTVTQARVSWQAMARGPNKTRLAQEATTQFIVENTPPSEPVLFGWGDCAGWAFNDDLHFHWLRNRPVQPDRIEFGPEDTPQGDALGRLLAERGVRFLSISRAQFEWLPIVSREVIEARYRRLDQCLWTPID